MKIEDEYYLTGIRKQDEKALELLYRSYYSMAVHLVLQNNGSEQEAKDVYQEAIIIFYEKVQEGLVLTCSIKTFIYSICRKVWLKRLSLKQKYLFRIEETEDFIAVDNLIGESEKKERHFGLMAESLLELGEPCRSLIEDFYIKGIGMAEITSKFRYTNTDNAKNQKYKCLQRLKKIFFRKDERQS